MPTSGFHLKGVGWLGPDETFWEILTSTDFDSKLTEPSNLAAIVFWCYFSAR